VRELGHPPRLDMSKSWTLHRFRLLFAALVTLAVQVPFRGEVSGIDGLRRLEVRRRAYKWRSAVPGGG